MIITYPASPVSSVRYASTSSSTAAAVALPVVRAADATPYEDIEDAVFKYIEAIRAIGKTRVNTSEIAEALSLHPRDVERAARNLHARGVKAL